MQTGKVERRIRDLTELSRSALIHANRRWPKAVDAHLWPYALRMANDATNEAMGTDGGPSPLEKFSRSPVEPNTRFWQPIFCPVYVSDQALQSDRAIKNKWEERSRVGIYLGRSPQHARSVALVLNLETGHVSPQFHCVFDPSFQTIKRSFGGAQPPSKWQVKCGFTQPTPDHEGSGIDDSPQTEGSPATQPTNSGQRNRPRRHRRRPDEPSSGDPEPGPPAPETVDPPPASEGDEPRQFL